MNLVHRFETFTGVPCRGLFDEDGFPLPLNVRLVVEQFVWAGGPARFKPGHRYFFGRLVG
jgi:hypothetical protein